jgi:hypothetical protein
VYFGSLHMVSVLIESMLRAWLRVHRGLRLLRSAADPRLRCGFGGGGNLLLGSYRYVSLLSSPLGPASVCTPCGGRALSVT